MSEEKEYDLKKSIEGLGKLAPILKDAHGNIIDGFHRRELDPNWPSMTVDSVQNSVQLELARLASNFCRRQVSKEEFEQKIGFLIGAGLTPEQISKAAGISVRTIYRYMPPHLKKPEPEQLAELHLKKPDIVTAVTDISKAQTLQTSTLPAKTQDMLRNSSQPKPQEMVECERCHVNASDCKPWNGHQLCAKCFERAELNPEGYKGYFKYLEKSKLPQFTRPHVPEFKPQETWEQRKAVMHPQVSKFEQLFDIEAAKQGLPHGLNHESICVKHTVPDKTYPLPNCKVFVYFDGPVHEGKEDRDEELRNFLRRWGDVVVEVDYDEPSDKMVKEAVELVRSELLRLGWTPQKEA